MAGNQRMTAAGQPGWPIAVEHSTRSPASELWATIATPGNLELCHPFCASNPVSVWNGEESRDEVHYLNGKIYQRRFVDWVEGVGYDLLIEESGERIATVSWRVESVAEDTSKLSITVRPSVLLGLPTFLQWLAHVAYLRPMLVRYLRSVVRGFDWYLTRGEPVPRNQFGRHRWFSK